MKVLICHPSFWIYGGAERVIVRLANYLTDHFIPTTILTTQMLPEIKLELKDTRLIECGNDYKVLNEWVDKIRVDFDVINFHNSPVQLSIFGKKHSNVWNCNEPPQIYLEGGEIPQDEINVVKNFIGNVVVADEFNQKRFKEIYDKDSTIIPYGIDYNFMQKGNPDKPTFLYGLKGKFVITQVGFVHPTKNQLRTIEIFKDVKKKIPNAHLMLVGYDQLPYKKEVERKATEYGILDNITFTGVVTHEDIRDLYYASDVIIAPIKSQGGWLSVFEAMSIGKPVIVSKEMTASNIFIKENIGFVGNFVDNIIKVWGMNKPLDTKGQKFVKDNLTWDKFCEGMVNIYKETINEDSAD